MGRGIKEGELLFSVASDSQILAEKEKLIRLSKREDSLEKFSEQLMGNLLKLKSFPSEIELNTHAVFEAISLIHSYLLGFIPNMEIIKPCLKILVQSDLSLLKPRKQLQVQREIISLISFFINIKTIHSEVVTRNMSNFDEISVFYLRLRNGDWNFHDFSIRPLLDQIFNEYGISDWDFMLLQEPSKVKMVFWYIAKAFSVSQTFAEVIKELIAALLKLPRLSSKTYKCLYRLREIEKENQDDSICTLLIPILGQEKSIQGARTEKIPHVKWPIEKWAKKVFDTKNFHEITIDSIDSTTFFNPKSQKKEVKTVGSKIYLGKTNGSEACFYMKDSRVSGGATGDLEGLKYIASCMISFFSKIPLYVWNDGAGANVKEGIISLNRAAEGFMFNSLIGANVSLRTFQRTIKGLPDRRLHNLLKEIHKRFPPVPRQGNSSFVISVGIGSSSGLDVYGASQGAIQVMLDSELCYRVLTGSNVIKSVTGVIMSNYDIGGGKVMSKWTGTVDLLAADKSELIHYIKLIQSVFCEEKSMSSIRRKAQTKAVKTIPFPDVSLINEDMIRTHVDDALFLPLKQDFHEANSVVGGFARLGGRHVLIMGARTQMGIQSLAGIIKAQELLDTSYKTASSQVLIIGSRPYYQGIKDNHMRILARTKFIKSLSKKHKIKIYIVMHSNQISHTATNSFADVIIFVKYNSMETEQLELAQKNCPFLVDSLGEAFDLSHQLINLLDSLPSKSKASRAKKPGSSPSIPSEHSKPYDIVEQIILKISDRGSFLEFFKEMNHEILGPSLITALAKVDRKTIGILADQPNILGGAPDTAGTEKFCMFMNFLQKNSIPLLMLSNSPGFLPGKKQELLRIQQIGARSLDLNILSDIPVVSVILNQNYGGRFIHAFSKYLRPGIVSMAFRDSVIAVMGSQASFDLFLGNKYYKLIDEKKNKEAIDLKQNYLKDFEQKSLASNDAFHTGSLDWLIRDRKELRKHIITALKLATVRKEILNSREISQSLKETCVNIFIEILQLCKYTAEKNNSHGVLLKKSKKNVSYSEIEDFVRGYNFFSQVDL